MSDDDQGDRLATALARAATQKYNAGGVTFSQALDAAFDTVNPDKKAALTRLVFFQIFGAPRTPVVPKRHRALADSGDAV